MDCMNEECNEKRRERGMGERECVHGRGTKNVRKEKKKGEGEGGEGKKRRNQVKRNDDRR